MFFIIQVPTSAPTKQPTAAPKRPSVAVRPGAATNTTKPTQKPAKVVVPSDDEEVKPTRKPTVGPKKPTQQQTIQPSRPAATKAPESQCGAEKVKTVAQLVKVSSAKLEVLSAKVQVKIEEKKAALKAVVAAFTVCSMLFIAAR